MSLTVVPTRKFPEPEPHWLEGIEVSLSSNVAVSETNLILHAKGLYFSSNLRFLSSATLRPKNPRFLHFPAPMDW